MYNRTISKEIKLLSQQFRVITVIGPRQAGKSTLCKLCFPNYQYVSLEAPDIRSFAKSDPRGFLKTYSQYVIFDEIQRVPELLSYLQEVIDQSDIKAQFILTGSHQLELTQAVTQSLAGRTALLTLFPLSFEELPIAQREPEQCIIEGFMPGRSKDNIDTDRYYRNYFQTYVERDVRAMAQLKDYAQFEKFVRLCAGRIGQVLNLSSIANDTGTSVPTIKHWLSILEASFIIFRLQPFFENFGKRLIKSPKIYFVDTGLAAWLLGIETITQLERDPLRGGLFENMIIAEAVKARLNRGKNPDLYYFRDSHGNEVDLLITRGRDLYPVEIKASRTWNNSFQKGLTYLRKIAGERVKKGIVCYAGEQARDTENYRLIPFKEIVGLRAQNFLDS